MPTEHSRRRLRHGGYACSCGSTLPCPVLAIQGRTTILPTIAPAESGSRRLLGWWAERLFEQLNP